MRRCDTLTLRKLDPELVRGVQMLAFDRGQTVRELCQELLKDALQRFRQDNPDGEPKE
jgi:hypothetical protein